ncbi:MAG TPA: DUF6036 family nucleotidyltransferase [Bryobacteraceae bacterium]|nr:DUF6036 family nucleotidyltransferase [Bryobacteraceae bacterium]
MPNRDPPDPWHSFLAEVDSKLDDMVHLACIGGFVLTVHYGLDRQTSDIDFLAVGMPRALIALLEKLAGKESSLRKKYGVYLDPVGPGIVDLPCDYRTRLDELFLSTYSHLRLQALDPYDLLLSRLKRNDKRDRDDVEHLAVKVPLESGALRQRYERELQPHLYRHEQFDERVEQWAEMIDRVREMTVPARPPHLNELS